MMNYFVSACGKITPRKHHRLMYGIFLVFVMLGAAQSALAYQANISGGAASVAVNQPIAANFVVTLTGGSNIVQRDTIVETTCGTLNPASPSQTLKTDGTEDLTFTFTAPGVSGSCTITAKGDTGVGDVTSTTFVVTITSGSSSTTSTTTTVSSSSTTSSATTTTLVTVHGSLDGLGSHTFPTYLFVASYDWLHNFHDANDEGRDSRNDPDTDNFNKIIALDSNLFPIITALAGDHEFPNITSRNTTTWAGTNAPSPYSPSVNDYFNRSLAVAPDFITQYDLPFQVTGTLDTADINADYYNDVFTHGITQYGARSAVKWAFVVDPGNHNIRRYEFKKFGDFYAGFNSESKTNLQDPPAGLDMGSVCNDPYPAVWYSANLPVAYDKAKCLYTSDLGGTCDPATAITAAGCFENEEVIWVCKHGDAPKDFTTATDIADHVASEPAVEYPVLDLGKRAATVVYEGGQYKVKVRVYGIARESSSDVLAVGINAKKDDPRPTSMNHATNAPSYAASALFQVQSGWNANSNSTCATPSATNSRDSRLFEFTLTGNINDYDTDSRQEGVQVRVSIYPLEQRGFIIDKISIGEKDSAFAVKQVGGTASQEVRWNNLTTFLELVPPESFPGYPSYTSFINGTVGYGFQTNTSFLTARNVRFKNPRDIDLYRDIFDADNEGPTYVFVADTMNSRIQVFMNATASAGETNADFPIRPVPVKGPNDSSTKTAFKSNELGMRIYSGVGAGKVSVGFGDGRKVDWRQYTTLPGASFINITTGQGEFYYPHGVAVDQDPDTKDVYLFVADTFNHRIQVFRDATGVTFQPITSKKFDFEFERSWGTYPLQTSEVRTPPGAYNFRYPKGLDIARFANNSSYLYVVDSKNYRVLKYLITESAEDISSISFVAGYGSNGTTFVRDLGSNHGVALDSNLAFEDDGLLAVGFLNPQDVSTGYSGFYLYSGPVEAGQSFRNEIYPDPANANLRRGVRYLNNYMLYVSDYARNNNSVGEDDLNMRVMQFIDNFKTITGVFLPWRTEPVTFTTVRTMDNLSLGQSVFGMYSGVHSSDAKSGVGGTTKSAGTGSTENAGVNDRFTNRPVGVAALTWDTISPFDMRVVDLSTSTVFSNGTTIDKDTLLRVGARSREFFGLPYSDIATYTDYMAADLDLDGKWVKRIHAFCYDTNSVFRGHTALPAPPFVFTPNDISSSCTGYMKVIAEDSQFGYSGKTGTLIFKMKP